MRRAMTCLGIAALALNLFSLSAVASAGNHGFGDVHSGFRGYSNLHDRANPHSYVPDEISKYPAMLDKKLNICAPGNSPAGCEE